MGPVAKSLTFGTHSEGIGVDICYTCMHSPCTSFSHLLKNEVLCQGGNKYSKTKMMVSFMKQDQNAQNV